MKASSGTIPRGSGENQRISPPSTAMGNQPLAYAEISSSGSIISPQRRTSTAQRAPSSTACARVEARSSDNGDWTRTRSMAFSLA